VNGVQLPDDMETADMQAGLSSSDESDESESEETDGGEGDLQNAEHALDNADGEAQDTNVRVLARNRLNAFGKAADSDSPTAATTTTTAPAAAAGVLPTAGTTSTSTTTTTTTKAYWEKFNASLPDTWNYTGLTNITYEEVDLGSQHLWPMVRHFKTPKSLSGEN
jgi:hypothetical protein